MANDIATAEAGSAPVVESVSGKLRGAREAGIYAFKGVPYGASTGSRNRFMPPQRPVPWTGVREALAYGGRARQLPDRAKRRAVLETLLGPADTMPEGEDCLTLNLWTPGLGDGAKRPVMVWLHGGAFAYGSGSRAVTDGANLARRGDVVVVNVNHRLNIFGFLHLADIGGAEWAHSGNAGMLDMIAALRWVRDNIAVFGGDPGNVTIFGESGGGGKVSVLLAMPEARGLFHRAIIQSGAAIRVATRERANALAAAVLEELGVRAGECERLQTLPAEQVLAAIAPASRAVGRSRWPLLDRYDFGPVVDGRDLPQHPADPDAPAIADDIPLMVGGTREESAFFLADDDQVWNSTLSEAELRERVTAVAGGETEALLAAYRQASPQASPADRLVAALTGSNFWVRSVLLAERYAARRPGAGLHVLARLAKPRACRPDEGASRDGPALCVRQHRGARHHRWRSRRAHDLAARMSATWVAFARNGSPNNPAIPSWPAYSTRGARDDDLRRRLPCRPRPRPRGTRTVDAGRQRLATGDHRLDRGAG